MRYLLLVLCFLMTGCASVPNFTSGQPPKLQESWTKDVIPVAVGEVKGKQVAVYETHVAVNRESIAAKKSIWSQIVTWFLGLGVLGGALAFFFPTVFFAIILWLMRKWKNLKDEYWKNKHALEETVKAIKDSNAVEEHPTLSRTLDSVQSNQTKTLVGQIKATL